LGNGGKMEPYTIIIMAQWFDTRPGCHNYFCKKKFILNFNFNLYNDVF
jgi:hypothetical protein